MRDRPSLSRTARIRSTPSLHFMTKNDITRWDMFESLGLTYQGKAMDNTDPLALICERAAVRMLIDIVDARDQKVKTPEETVANFAEGHWEPKDTTELAKRIDIAHGELSQMPDLSHIDFVAIRQEVARRMKEVLEGPQKGFRIVG